MTTTQTIPSIEEIVSEADRLLAVGAFDDENVVGDYTYIYNERTGQSKCVVLYRPLNLIIKSNYFKVEYPDFLSGLVLGTVSIDDKDYMLRLPLFEYVGGMEVQEYVKGRHCDCYYDDSIFRCSHALSIREVSGVIDSHYGNWMIVDETQEVVFFDFDGINAARFLP